MSERVSSAVLGEPGRYEVQEFPRPTLPDETALMRMEIPGICGTDKHTFAGETKQYAGTSRPTRRFRSSRVTLERYADRYPFAEMVTHEFGLADAETAMRTSMSPESMKVAIVPGRG
jgi:threonine dehydrogenase-like Zn-dependent dehydrogenase